MVAPTVIVHQSRSVAHYLRPDLIPRTLWRHRQLIGQLVRRNLAVRYRGSALGVLWSFVLPLLMLAVYTFVFSVILGAKWSVGGAAQAEVPRTQFAMMLWCGLLLFNVFSETATGSTGVIVANPSYVKKVVFPLEVLAPAVLGTAIVNGLISFGMLLIGLLLFQHSLPVTLVLVPLTVIPLALLCLGLGWLLASVGVYLRDTGQIIGVAMQILVFLTPIFYSVDGPGAPPLFKFLMRLNPLTVIVENTRRVAMRGESPEWGWLAAVGVLGLIAMQLGYVWFMKTKRGFADVL